MQKISCFNVLLLDGTSFNIQVLVEQHKRALDKVKTDIKEKLGKDFEHIEDVLDNAIKEITSELTDIIKKSYKGFRKEIKNLQVKSRSRYTQILEELKMAQFIIDELKDDYEYHHKRLISFLQNYILVFEGLKRYLDYLEPPDPIKETHIYWRYRPNYEKKDRRELIEELNKFLFDKTLRSKVMDEGIKAAKEFKDKASEIGEVLNKNRMDFSPPKLDYKNTYSKELGILSKRISELEGLISKISKMKRYVLKLGGLEVFLKSILEIRSKATRREMKGSLKPKFVKFIDSMPYTRIKLSDFRKELDGMKKNSKQIVYKLKNVTNLMKYLQVVDQRMRFLPEDIVNYEPDNIENIIPKLLQYKQNVRNKVFYTRGDLKKFGVHVFEIKGQKHPDSFIDDLKVIQGKILNKVESYIRKLRSIQKIQEILEEIKRKKGELSTTKSKVIEVTNVESGIAQLKQIQGTMKDFGFVATPITSLEHAYNSEATSLEDIGVGVRYLKDIVINTRKVRSDIDSYIKFLEGIGRSSEVLESMKSEVMGVPSIWDTKKRLIACISSLRDKLSSIEMDIAAIRKIGCRMCNINELKLNIESIKRRIASIRENLVSVQRISDSIHTENAKIRNQLKIINPLVHISSNIESSSLSLSNTGISYTKPESDSQKNLIECLFRAGQASEFIGSYTVKTIYRRIKSIEKEIDSLEKSIDSLMKCFLKCSNKSITENTKESTKRSLSSGDQVYNNEFTKSISDTRNVSGSEMNKNENVWTMLSNMALVESKFVFSRLYEFITMADNVLTIITLVDYCPCFVPIRFNNDKTEYSYNQS